jgi:hypothetical protein
LESKTFGRNSSLLTLLRPQKNLQTFEYFSYFNHALLVEDKYSSVDIFISHSYKDAKILRYMYYYLWRSFNGEKTIWFDQTDGLDKSCLSAVARSKYFIVCFSKEYQDKFDCLEELSLAVKMGKVIIFLHLKAYTDESWMNKELYKIMRENTYHTVDISSAAENFISDEKVNNTLELDELFSCLLWCFYERNETVSCLALLQILMFLVFS